MDQYTGADEVEVFKMWERASEKLIAGDRQLGLIPTTLIRESWMTKHF
jgi:hypothetical protein